MASTLHRKIYTVLGLILFLILALTWQANPGPDVALAQAGCPCSIWDDTATPAILSVNDPSAIELGVKFQADVDGYITGIRFYKGNLNTGTHIGNLWTSTGQLLASATSVNETDTGWQQVGFAAPVAISANTTYVASYHTEVGFYSASGGYFGIEEANPPLRALANGGADGGNGVYQYGPTGFPASSFNATNYWVDVVFDTSITPDAIPPTVSLTNPTDGAVVSGTVTVSADAADDMAVAGVQFLLDGVNLGTEDTVAPYSVTWLSSSATNGLHQLTAVARDGAGNTTASTAVNVTVENPVDTTAPTVSLTSPTEGSEVTGSVTASAVASDDVGVIGVQFLLDGANLGAEDTVPPYTMEWDSTTAANGPHTLTALARDAAGNTASSVVSVAVVPLGANCPCSIWDETVTPTSPSFPDPSAIELGVKFQSDVDGYITGIRFYKGSLNTGTHIGNLWTSTGQLLASATFVNETDTGWQQVGFAAPVAISANTTYVASYHTDVGFYSVDLGYFGSEEANPPLRATANGGVYRYGATGFPDSSGSSANYWVDVVLAADVARDTELPVVSMTQPTNGVTVSSSVTVSADVTDNVGVAGVQFLLDGANLGAEDTAPPYTMEWDSTTVANGVYQLAAVAWDDAGNTTTSSIVSVIVDNNTTPTVTIAAPTGGSTFNEGDTISFSGTASDVEDGDLTANLLWTSSIDGPVGSGGSFSRQDLSIGRHTLTASVTDSGGLTDSDQVDITIDAVAPVINVQKFADKKYILSSGEEVVYSVSVRNDSVTTDPVYVTSIVDDANGDVLNANPKILWTDCTTAGILPGETYTCNFGVFLQTGTLGDHTNIITVTATDDEDTGAIGTGAATVTVLPPSAVTDSTNCYYDYEPDIDGQQFRLIFTPDMQLWPANKLRASNPGQFFYNVFYTGSGPADFTVVVPTPFVTQGAMPVHVYTEVSVVSVGGFDCFVPDPSSEIYAGNTLDLAAVPVPDGFVYMTVHLDYGLKGTSGYAQNLNGDAVDAKTGNVLIPNLNDYTFEVNGSQVDSQTIQNVNALKRIPGIGGLVIDGLGNPIVGVQVNLYDPDGQLMFTKTTDEDGWYMFNYKHKGRQAEFTIELPSYSLSQTVNLKANKFAEVSFTIE